MMGMAAHILGAGMTMGMGMDMIMRWVFCCSRNIYLLDEVRTIPQITLLNYEYMMYCRVPRCLYNMIKG